MKKFFNLLAFEMRRVQLAYAILVGLIAIGQLSSVFLANREYIRTYEWFMEDGGKSMQEFLDGFGSLSYFLVLEHAVFISTVFLGIFALLTYAIVIWYRDWLGKASFSYRILALPGGRFSIFASKMTLMFLLIMGLIVVQILSVFLGSMILERIAPVDAFVSYPVLDLMQNNPMLSFIIPPNFLDFIVNYIVGFSFLFILFMMIVLELSFKVKGMILNIFLVFIILFSVWVILRFDVFFYLLPMERIYLTIATSILLSVAASFVSKLLLDNKVRA